jgi:hypothetical protein
MVTAASLGSADMLPTFFIIGAAKAGTTALFFYLDLHPEVQMSSEKEPDFFADPDGYLPFGRVSSLRRYERLFESASPVRGEASHTYSVYPLHEGVPERIHALVPDAKFIYLVRDPIDRMRAWYIQNQSWQRPLAPREALGDIHDPRNEYIAGGKYMSQIERYLAVFGRDQLLVVEQDELRTRRKEALGTVFDFLGAAPGYWTPEFDQPHNLSSDRVHVPRPIRRIVRSRASRAVQARLPEGVREGIMGAGKAAVGRPIPPAEFPPSLVEECREIFRPDAEALRSFTQRNFETWSV